MTEPKAPILPPVATLDPANLPDAQLDELADSVLDEIGGGVTTGGGVS